MIKEFELTENQKKTLFAAKQSEDKQKAINEVWEGIAKTQGFDIKTVKNGSKAGIFTAEFLEAEEQEALPKIEEDETFEMLPSNEAPPVKKEDDDLTSPVRFNTLISENFKKLNISIEANGKSFEVRGDNGIGKSSVIDAIFTTLQGMKGNTVEEPIQKGKDSADNIVELELMKDMEWGDKILPTGTIIRAERTFTTGGNKLNVRIDGKKMKSPKELLDFIVGASSVADPTALWEMKQVDLKKYLTQVSGIADELNEIEVEKKAIYDEKYQVEQEIERFDKELLDYADIEGEVVKPNFEEIQKSIDDANKKKDEIRESEAQVALLDKKLEEVDANGVRIYNNTKETESRIQEFQKAIKDLEAILLNNKEEHKLNLKQLEETQAKLNIEKENTEKLRVELSKLPDRSEELKNLQKEQEKFTRFGIKKNILERRGAKLIEQDAIMESVRRIEEKRSALFVSAKMPIKHLFITDEGVMYKGVPLTKDQISEAEGLELCMDILIAQNPKLRLIACKYGHAFSNKTLTRVLSKAKYRDYQLIIERVSDAENLEIEFIEL